VVTNRQNCQNKRNLKTCPYPGVSYHKCRDNYRATIRINNNKQIHLGSFKVPEEAFLAYQKAVKALGQEVLDY
jgi:hypothetical protein